jgi:hypothetical protein
MKAAIAHAVAGVLLVAAPSVAQVTKTITGEVTTAKATVEAIERTTRQVTLKNEDGTYEVLTVPLEMKKFDTLKIGDVVKARYYENVVFRLKEPGEAPVDSAGAAMTRPGAGAGATMAEQRRITATITAIDPKVPSISFKGPNGWAYSSRVEDTKTLAKVKVGDQVDITWTKAALLSVEDAK